MRATSRQKHNQRLPSHPHARVSGVSSRERKHRVGRERDVKQSNTQVSPPGQGPGSPTGDSGPLREGLSAAFTTCEVFHMHMFF